MVLHQPCPTQMAYWAKNYTAILTRATHGMTLMRAVRCMAYFDLSKLNIQYLKTMYSKRSNPNCNGNRRDKVALRATCIKNVIQKYQNKEKLSVCRILLLQRQPKLGRIKPSTRPNVARGWDVTRDGFTHRPWPRVPRIWGPRAILYDNSVLTKNLRNCAEA